MDNYDISHSLIIARIDFEDDQQIEHILHEC